VRQVPAVREIMPMIVSPGFSIAKNTPWFALEPEFGCTLRLRGRAAITTSSNSWDRRG